MLTQPERQGSQKGTHNQGTKLQMWLTNSKVWGKPTTSHKSTKLTTACGLCITCVHLIRCLCRWISEAPKEEVFTYLMRTLPVLALITAFFWLYYVGSKAQQNSKGTIQHKAPVTVSWLRCIMTGWLSYFSFFWKYTNFKSKTRARRGRGRKRWKSSRSSKWMLDKSVW